MSQTVLFAGGPLHGQTKTVDDRVRTVYALESAEISPGLPDMFGPPFRQVAYNMSRFAICGRIVWIGHLGAEPDDYLVFDVLASDGAKQASVLWPTPPTRPAATAPPTAGTPSTPP